MDRLTDSRTAEALKRNAESGNAEIPISDLRYIRLAEYEENTAYEIENAYSQGYNEGYEQGRAKAQDEINRLREYIARQSEEEYD
jgi:flagellar biosynthesis/type III secretory pathway protein FliH